MFDSPGAAGAPASPASSGAPPASTGGALTPPTSLSSPVPPASLHCDGKCKAAAPCYTLGCQNGQMRQDGAWLACAAVKGECDACYLESPCGMQFVAGLAVLSNMQLSCACAAANCNDAPQDTFDFFTAALGAPPGFSCAQGASLGFCEGKDFALVCPRTCNVCVPGRPCFGIW